MFQQQIMKREKCNKIAISKLELKSKNQKTMLVSSVALKAEQTHPLPPCIGHPQNGSTRSSKPSHAFEAIFPNPYGI